MPHVIPYESDPAIFLIYEYCGKISAQTTKSGKPFPLICSDKQLSVTQHFLPRKTVPVIEHCITDSNVQIGFNDALCQRNAHVGVILDTPHDDHRVPALETRLPLARS